MQVGSYSAERTVEQYGAIKVYVAQVADEGQPEKGRTNRDDAPVLLTVFQSAPPDAAQRWIERYRAVSRLRHISIIPFIDSGSNIGPNRHDLYVVTRLVQPVLGRERVLSPDTVLEVSRQICGALAYAHSQGVHHGMLHPVHVVRLGPDDFALRGFELAIDSSPSLSKDIVALGQFFHRALVGQSFEGVNISPKLPRPLAEVFRKSVLGARGFESASAFHAALSQAIRALPPEQRSQPLVATAPSRPSARTIPLIVIIPLLALLAIVVAAFLLIRQGNANIAILPTVAVVSRVSDTATSLPPVNSQAVAQLPSATGIPPTPTETPVPISAATVVRLTPSRTLAEVATSAPSATVTVTVPVVAGPATTVATTAATTAASEAPSEAVEQPGVITATPMVILSDTPTFTPTATEVPPTPLPDTPTSTPAPPKPCMSLVGDSVTHGGVTYEIPDSGYIVGLTHPLAEFVNDALRAQNINNLIAYDRGASNTGINSSNHASYFKSPAYSQLLQDHCKFTVIMPWYNDITPGKVAQTDAAPQHVRAIISLVRILTERNPGGRILLLNYYQGAVAEFAADTWANGFTPETRDLYNHEIGSSCDVGTLSQITQVTCINSDDAFQGMGSSYVISTITRDELNQNLVAPLSDIQQGWLDQYFATNPGGTLQGDGIHLSTGGKKALSAFLVGIVQSLPDLPPSGPSS